MLDRGAARGQVAAPISESAQHVELFRGRAEAGFWVKDADTAAVARLYDAALDRRPEGGGLAHHVSPLKAGTLTRLQLARTS